MRRGPTPPRSLRQERGGWIPRWLLFRLGSPDRRGRLRAGWGRLLDGRWLDDRILESGSVHLRDRRWRWRQRRGRGGRDRLARLDRWRWHIHRRLVVGLPFQIARERTSADQQGHQTCD